MRNVVICYIIRNNSPPSPFRHLDLACFISFRLVPSLRSFLPSIFFRLLRQMGLLSAARLVHAANTRAVADLVFKLKLARAAQKVSGDAVAREVVQEERNKLAKLSPKPKATVKKMGKPLGKKGTICKPCEPAKRGRPSSGECNACKRLLAGKKGGKPHTCGRIPYSRIG